MNETLETSLVVYLVDDRFDFMVSDFLAVETEADLAHLGAALECQPALPHKPAHAQCTVHPGPFIQYFARVGNLLNGR